MTKAFSNIAELLVKGTGPKTKAQEVLETYIDKSPTKVEEGLQSLPEADESKNIFEALSSIFGKKITKKDIDIGKEELSKTRSGYKDIIIEDLEESVRDVTEGKKTVEAHKELVDKLKPIRPFESSPSITEPEEIPFVLRANKLYDKDGVVKENAGVYQLNKNIKDGEFIETRLDIPAYLDFDKWVAVLTRTSQGKKENIYSPTALLQNVEFKPGSNLAAKVGRGDRYTSGKSKGKKYEKGPFGTIKGQWINHNPKALETLANKLINSLEYVQVGHDPRRHGVFYTRENFKQGDNIIPKQTAIEYADEVIQVGPLVLAKNPRFTNIQNYEKGGMIAKDYYKNYNTQRAI